MKSLTDSLNPGGILFLQGPRPLKDDPVIEMPFFRQHLKMCPENKIHPDITLFFAQKK